MAVGRDSASNLYIAEQYSGGGTCICIRKITLGGVVSTLAGSTTNGMLDGQGAAAQFYSPRNVTVDANGNVYVGDGNPSVYGIRKITPSGNVTTLHIGSGSTNQTTKGMAIDGNGTLYITYNNSGAVYKLASGASTPTIFAGSTTTGYTDGTTTAARFYRPSGLMVTPQGVIYLADASNYRIRKIE